ncbi:MAG: hypothetical protein ACJA08_000502 [Cyclobacteriaceae bacterium]|jgi:hypothetical protein
MLKGNTTIKLLLILGVLAGGYAIVKLTSGGARSKSYREVLVDIDTARVTRVEISSGGINTVLAKKEGAWIVNEDKNAMSASVRSMLNSLNTIKPSRLASRSKTSWQDFQVDSTGTRVQIYEGSDEALDLILGRFGVEGQRSYYSYVRLEEDEDTYVANNFMAMSIGKTAADYRNNQIVRLKKDSINSIDFNYAAGTYTLLKGSNGKWSMAGVAADSANVAQYLNGLGIITSKKFEDGTVGESDKEMIIHLNGSDDITVKSFAEGVLNSSFNEAEIFNDKSVYDKLFKSPEYFTGG